MPVYLITLHAYRSWNADHRRGFVQRGKGIQPPNPALANSYSNMANHPPVTFDSKIQSLLVWATYDICVRRQWHLHAVATDTTHVHSLISWNDGEIEWNEVRRRQKNVLSWMLGRYMNRKGGHWFVEDGSRKLVPDVDHFRYLKTTYLPKHSGLQWYEGPKPPEIPAGWVEPEKAAHGLAETRGE